MTDRHPYPPITPHLTVPDVGAALVFYVLAFGAEELVRLTLPDGSAAHGEMLVGGGLVTLGPAADGTDLAAPAPDAGVHASVTWSVADVDKAATRAVEAGATLTSPPTDQFHGDRTAPLRDPFSHRWILATPLAPISYATQQSRLTTLLTPP